MLRQRPLQLVSSKKRHLWVYTPPQDSSSRTSNQLGPTKNLKKKGVNTAVSNGAHGQGALVIDTETRPDMEEEEAEKHGGRKRKREG